MSQYTDDFITSLLKKEAAVQATRFGGPAAPATRPARIPKPNTRFLRNIVREVDSHNTALLAREAAEAQARLRRLRRKADGRLSRSPERERERSREREVKAMEKKQEREREREREREGRLSRSPEGARQARRRHHERDDHSRSERRRRHGSREKSPKNGETDRARHTDRHKKRSRSEPPEGDRHTNHHHRHKDRDRRSRHNRSRSRSKQGRRRRRHRDKELEEKDGGSVDERHREKKRRMSDSKAKDLPADAHDDHRKLGDRGPSRHERSASQSSDASEDFIGPAAQTQAEPRARGRGTTGKAAMDSRFLDDYNPALDSQSPVDEVEAFRDRQRLKNQGAQRLRAERPGEDFIKAWEDNDTQNPNNIKWTKKGDTREWDRGKVLEDDSSGDLRADWIKALTLGSSIDR